jgi:hypothetical protein
VVAELGQISSSCSRVIEWFVSELMVKMLTAAGLRLELEQMVRKFSRAVAVQHLMVGDLCLEKQVVSRIGLGTHLGKERLGMIVCMDILLTYLLLFNLNFNNFEFFSFKNRYFSN